MIPVVIAIVYGSFYIQNSSNLGSNNGYIFMFHPKNKLITCYILFVFFEFFINFYIIHTKLKENKYYVVVFLELLIIPLCQVGEYNDFCMRASIPALFLLMIFLMQYILEKIQYGGKFDKIYSLILISLCCLTSTTEIQRSLKFTLDEKGGSFENKEVYSFGHVHSKNDKLIKLIFNQYICTNYKNSFFGVYILK